MKSKRQQLQALDRAFTHLEETMRDQHALEFSAYLAAIRENENKHRAFTQGDNGLTISQAVKLFAVQYVAEYLTGARTAPHVRDYFRTPQAQFMACAFAINYETLIRQALIDVDLEEIKRLDYAKLNA